MSKTGKTLLIVAIVLLAVAGGAFWAYKAGAIGHIPGIKSIVNVDKQTPPAAFAITAYPILTFTNQMPDYLLSAHVKRGNKNVAVSVDTSRVKLNVPGTYGITFIARDTVAGSVDSCQTTVRVVDPKHKMVFLTFDDGPSANTPIILKILRDNGVHATFFVTAQNKKCLHYMKQAVDEGNAVAVHSYTHQFSIYTTQQTYFNDLEAMQREIEKYTGRRSNVIRFPGGSSNRAYRHHAKDPNFMVNLCDTMLARGYNYVDWNVESHDATGNHVPVSTILYYACSDKHPQAVVLMHDTKPKVTTVQALPQIIKFYKDHGYEFATIQGLGLVNHHNISRRSVPKKKAAKAVQTR